MIAMVPPLTCGLTETYTVTLLEVSSPSIRGTVDSTYYTHYSTLSTVEANWSLGSLSCDSTSKNLLDVYPFIFNATSYTNLDVSIADIPLTKTTSTIPGPLNVQHYVPVTVKHVRCWRGRWSRVCRIRRRHQRHHRDCQSSRASQPSLAAQGKTVPWLGPRVAAASPTRPVEAVTALLALGRAWSVPRCSGRFLWTLQRFF
ncbi:hypothetical protein H4582DRAFT_2003628 [Lactarius indigo]|nr:hypothetical protein H4582DRAFT_2003628 [Lactarius indigo]